HTAGSRPSARPPGEAFRKAGLMAVPLLVVLALAELGGHAWFRHRYHHSFEAHHVFHPHPAYVFALNPGDHDWEAHPHDHEGFFHIPPLKPSDGPRLWTLGGSTTAANPDGSDWPTALQKLVAPAGMRVVNMGHGGRGTDQVHRHYRT